MTLDPAPYKPENSLNTHGRCAQVEATTRGVRVRASVIFQMDGPATARSGYLFAYRCDVFRAKEGKAGGLAYITIEVWF